MVKNGVGWCVVESGDMDWWSVPGLHFCYHLAPTKILSTKNANISLKQKFNKKYNIMLSLSEEVFYKSVSCGIGMSENLNDWKQWENAHCSEPDSEDEPNLTFSRYKQRNLRI